VKGTKVLLTSPSPHNVVTFELTTDQKEKEELLKRVVTKEGEYLCRKGADCLWTTAFPTAAPSA